MSSVVCIQSNETKRNNIVISFSLSFRGGTFLVDWPKRYVGMVCRTELQTITRQILVDDVTKGIGSFRIQYCKSEHTESGMPTRSGSVCLPEGEKIAFNLSEDDVFQNRASDVSSGIRRSPTH